MAVFLKIVGICFVLGTITGVLIGTGEGIIHHHYDWGAVGATLGGGIGIGVGAAVGVIKADM